MARLNRLRKNPAIVPDLAKSKPQGLKAALILLV
jgi:hypothetical protein